MNSAGDIPLTHAATPDTRPCGLISILPTLGMASCRGRAEAFARSLSSKLKTLGSQTHDDPKSQESEPVISSSSNTWVASHNSEPTVTDLQPLRHESEPFFDFDCELESPASPVDECEYLRLVDTASSTPHNSVAESGYVCTSTASSRNSTDGPYYDVERDFACDYLLESVHSAHTRNESVDSLKLNGNITVLERLSNGHACQPAEAQSLKAHQGEDKQLHKEDEADTRQEENVSPANTEVEKMRQLSAQEVFSVQDQIIHELQKQSESISGSAATCGLECGTDTRAVVLEAGTTADTSNSTQVFNTAVTISSTFCSTLNGNLDHGEEVLQIELTDVSLDVSALQQNQKSPTMSGGETEFPADEKDQQKAVDVSLQPESDACKKLPIAKDSAHTRSALDTDEEDDCRPQRVRRCSSLKSGKTPPGTPGRKKIVRFADVLGLDLADVKTFLDEIPTIPRSAFEDLEILESEQPIQLGPKSDKLLMPLFQQPGGLPTFLDLVREKQVSLENAVVSDPINQTITGSIRVRNLDFHKSVHIRYTLDGWRSFADLQANYVQNSCDGFSDKFVFEIFGNSLQIGQRLELAVRFQCKGQQFWDNNYGANYCFQCLPAKTTATSTHQSSAPSFIPAHIVGLPSVADTWCSSFY